MKLEKLDRYIDGNCLSRNEMATVINDPLLLLAYDAGNTKSYIYILQLSKLVRKTYGRFKLVKEVFYIIGNTQLSLWQKLKAKIRYLTY